MEGEMGAQAARFRALAVLRVRSRAIAVALLPAAVAVVLLAGGVTGRIGGGSWDVVRWFVTGAALLVLLAAAGVALVVARARPAVSPTVPIAEESAPDLYRLVRDLADRLEVPAPSAIALTPDCDSWLEDRTHPAHGPPLPAAEGSPPGRSAADSGSGTAAETAPAPPAPVLVIGSPFLWWMRVAELRAVLAPVVAGTGPSAHPDIAAARRFVRGLDAAVAVASKPGRGSVPRVVLAGVGWVSRLLLRACRGHAAEMERGVAAAAAERAKSVDYGLRIVAQEQVGLAYAGWDRLLTRVALPAWRMGRWPDRLDAGVVAALTELSRRDRLAEGFASRLGERPACDLLEEPGVVDEATSLLAARLFHGGPAERGPDWAPVGWQEYPEEVVDRKWRTDAARLHRVLNDLGVRSTSTDAAGTITDALGTITDARGASTDAHGASTAKGDPEPPTLARIMEHLAARPTGAGPSTTAPGTASSGTGPNGSTPSVGAPAPTAAASTSATSATSTSATSTTSTSAVGTRAKPDLTEADTAMAPADTATFPDPTAPLDLADVSPTEAPEAAESAETAALAARLTAEVAREEAAVPVPAAPGGGPDEVLWGDGQLPLFPLQSPRSGRELLTDHVLAMICCAAVDTAGAAPGLDWLDGPTLLVSGERAVDLTPRVQSLVEDGDPEPLRGWLKELGVRPEKPVRLV
ncbi:hypothetical protein RCO28_26115 [Streptomyces sp. LHD-70]|uniref:hypothetical protein n=1 Tax=Streptomyces sp. LHD-70 TaxID=3072140 RepID=UPI00280E486E|nr:hypothetical protein [Streptomyces sp. LHD-70]MDQ8705939.1 hypothetical protein [Streptomyces sp. LHD-70]